ncbi:bifunctional methylenetetrahydrofolate dehydrogenase/methenyltetrahydrofolate cyclohydrolase FolD [Polymorphobacter arshaanensis]|uniref:Bifunctional protein FolD n=1 Tax=Glacieibacterium arshaanense TaxID=2511025 RepID=A0A4Y9EMP0_9SPHN|nr:bifunctional methylenetetrahydrofolate dehydrogenase/methenyltetrahydrofolate cyclohydrolase FolD [Polymorphobacter arshaanensis]TFU03288.1 bifunctional methylenetetrahydrofolate dehydrogenase/methenyltetrahydrofolate cyclohydrolase FolD [Polymorphobacter arshaanensis]
MSARIIDGKAFAEGLRARIAAAVPEFAAAAGRVPGLAVVLVGDDAASQIYVRNKGKQTIEAGMHSVEIRLPANATQAEVEAVVASLNVDPAIDGILVQLPLPKHLNEAPVINAIDPDKDVDGLHPVSAGRLVAGLPGLVPCTPMGCMLLLRDVLGDVGGAEALVIGRSRLVGKPIAALLTNANATVTLAHSRTHELSAHVHRADIVVAAVGVPELVRGAWIKHGATVIDVGMNRIDVGGGKTRLVGDVAFAEAVTIAGAITPVPGGVGPMTIACLLRNTLVAAHARAGLAPPPV